MASNVIPLATRRPVPSWRSFLRVEPVVGGTVQVTVEPLPEGAELHLSARDALDLLNAVGDAIDLAKDFSRG